MQQSQTHQQKVYITNVMAGSLDGAIASHPEESDNERKAMGFINEADHDHVRHLLSTCDAVVVGAHSVNVSGGVMEVLNDQGKHPTWIMCTRTGFDAADPIWNAPATPKWLVSNRSLPDEKTKGADRTVIYDQELGSRSLVEAICEACAEADLKRVLLFGGGFINSEFYEAGAVDAFTLTVCPVIIGSEHRVPIVQPTLTGPTHFKLEGIKTEGDLVFIHYIAKA